MWVGLFRLWCLSGWHERKRPWLHPVCDGARIFPLIGQKTLFLASDWLVLMSWEWEGGVQLQLISRLLLPRTWYETLHLDINKESLMCFYFLITDSTLIHVKCLPGCSERKRFLQIPSPSLFSPLHCGLQTGLRPALASSRLKFSPPPWLTLTQHGKLTKRETAACCTHEMEQQSVLTPNIAPIKQGWENEKHFTIHHSYLGSLQDTSPSSLYYVGLENILSSSSSLSRCIFLLLDITCDFWEKHCFIISEISHEWSYFYWLVTFYIIENVLFSWYEFSELTLYYP